MFDGAQSYPLSASDDIQPWVEKYLAPSTHEVIMKVCKAEVIESVEILRCMDTSGKLGCFPAGIAMHITRAFETFADQDYTGMDVDAAAPPAPSVTNKEDANSVVEKAQEKMRPKKTAPPISTSWDGARNSDFKAAIHEKFHTALQAYFDANPDKTACEVINHNTDVIQAQFVQDLIDDPNMVFDPVYFEKSKQSLIAKQKLFHSGNKLTRTYVLLRVYNKAFGNWRKQFENGKFGNTKQVSPGALNVSNKLTARMQQDKKNRGGGRTKTEALKRSLTLVGGFQNEILWWFCDHYWMSSAQN